MQLDIGKERKRAHELVDQLSPTQLGAVRSVLEVMVDVDEVEEELTDADRVAIQAGLDSLEKHGAVSMKEVRADFGLTLVDPENDAHRNPAG